MLSTVLRDSARFCAILLDFIFDSVCRQCWTHVASRHQDVRGRRSKLTKWLIKWVKVIKPSKFESMVTYIYFCFPMMMDWIFCDASSATAANCSNLDRTVLIEHSNWMICWTKRKLTNNSIQILLPFKFCFRSNSAVFSATFLSLRTCRNVSQRVATIYLCAPIMCISICTLIPLLSLTNIECGRLTIRFVCCLYD